LYIRLFKKILDRGRVSLPELKALGLDSFMKIRLD
jgi:hypothetical protein